MSSEPAAPLTDPVFDPADPWAGRLAGVARALPYPPTPALAARLRPPQPARRVVPAWGYAVALAVALAALLLAVPSTRAGLLEFIQIGVVRLQFGPTATPKAVFSPTATPARTPRPTLTRVPSATPLGSVLDLAGETTLAEARAQVSFQIPLPSYPADLGAPDRVFVQDLDGAAVVLVWLDPDDPARVRLTLHVLSAPALPEKLIYAVMKDSPPGLIVTEVDGHPAVWTTGPYVLHTRGGGLDEYRLIEGQVLIWSAGPLTYRLETDLSLAEAQLIAASLSLVE